MSLEQARIAAGLVLLLLPALSPGGNQETPEREGAGDRAYFQARGYHNLGISLADLPRRGHCRIWFPDRLASEQPDQGKCALVSRQVPPGAWLVARPTADPEHVLVHVLDEHIPGVVRTIGIFSVETREFVRYLSP